MSTRNKMYNVITLWILISGNRLSYCLPGLESIGGNRVFSTTLWQHLIPAGFLNAVYELNGPSKWCRVDEKPADKRFTALIF